MDKEECCIFKARDSDYDNDNIDEISKTDIIHWSFLGFMVNDEK